MIKYRITGHPKYKYEQLETYSIPTKVFMDMPVETQYLRLETNGVLYIKGGSPDSYYWDGPSGPTIDTANSMRASLVHDALYQLMRLGLIPYKFRLYSDDLFRQILLQDFMFFLRADIWYLSVRLFGKFFNERKYEKWLKI